MMYGLRHDLREVREAIIGGYTRRNGDPSLAGTLARVGGFGALTGLSIMETRRFMENPDQNSGIRATLLGVATTYAAVRAGDKIHDFAYSIQRTQPDITETR